MIRLKKRDVDLIKKALFCTVIAVINSFFYGNYLIMLFLTIGEVATILFFLVNKKYIKCISYYMIFMCLSMENKAFVGTDIFYGLKNFKIAGINVGVLLLVPMLLFLILNNKYKRIYKFPSLKKILLFETILLVIGVIIGVFNVIVNDNQVNFYGANLQMIIRASYNYVIIALEMWVFGISLASNDDNQVIGQSLASIIIAVFIDSVLCLVFQNYGNRGGTESLQLSNVYMVLGAAPLLLFYKNESFFYKFTIGVSGLFILILTLVYNSSGKLVLTFIFLPVMLLFVLKDNRRIIKNSIFILIFIIFLLIIFAGLSRNFSSNNYLFFRKIEQAIGLISFWKKDWLANIPSSPKMRITEFLNIANEYYNKPWYLLFGKGVMGTITDRLGIFPYFDVDSAAFSSWEVLSRRYYAMHETLNVLFLTNGIMGLLFYTKIILYGLKNAHSSFWLLLGTYWFAFFYNYSITISVFGILSLMYGIKEAEIKKEI